MAGEFEGFDIGSEFGAQGNLAGVLANNQPDVAGANNLPTSGGSTDFGELLKGVANPLLDVGKTVLGLQVMKDTLANQAADRQLGLYAKQLQLAGAKQQLDVNGQLASIKAATELAKARNAFSFQSLITPNTLILIGLVIVAWLWLSHRKAK